MKMRNNWQICAKNKNETASSIFVFILKCLQYGNILMKEKTRKNGVHWWNVIRYCQHLRVCDLFTLFFHHQTNTEEKKREHDPLESVSDSYNSSCISASSFTIQSVHERNIKLFCSVLNDGVSPTTFPIRMVIYHFENRVLYYDLKWWREKV